MTDALRERAELHLLDLLGYKRRADFVAAVEALREVGALTDAEAEAWVSRFAAGLRPYVGPPAPRTEAGIPDAARALLEELLAPSARSRGRGTMRADRSGFERALAGLRDCQAISGEEYSRWSDRFLAHPELAAEAREDLERWERALRRGFDVGVSLQGVLVAPATPLGDLRIRHLELYCKGLRLYWYRPMSEQEAAAHALPAGSRARSAWYMNRPARPLPEVRDDLGLRYESLLGGREDFSPERDDSSVAFERADYTPVVQGKASWLELAYQGEQMQLRLDA